MGTSQKIFLGQGMAEVILGIPELIEQGKKFTFQNFASKGPRGFPNAYSGDWLVWTHQVNGIVAKIGQSTISSQIALDLDLNLLGENTEKFEQAKALIMSGLEAAQRVFGDAIPASDRTVSLGHNSQSRRKRCDLDASRTTLGRALAYNKVRADRDCGRFGSARATSS